MKSALLLLWWVTGWTCIVNGKTESSTSADDPAASNNNYKEATFVYPPGIRSERDIPVCPSWIQKDETEIDKEVDFTGHPDRQGDMPSDGNYQSDHSRQDQISSSPDIMVTGSSVANGNLQLGEESLRWESACNIVHRRYFYPPVIERLCRCPDRTECPWEWSQPPSYQHSLASSDSKSSGTAKGSRDPYTLMISSRSQAKFCTEVTTGLPRCKNLGGGKKEPIPVLRANMVKSVRRTATGDEIPRVSINCYCPPLYRKWSYVGQTEPTDYANGTLETNFFYKCDRLPICNRNQKCGNIRTDLHFSFYHCSCPRNHLCLPRNYPPENVSDVEEDVNEVLFRGQVSPAFCTPFH